jgi:hypothetical protein
MAAGDPVAYEVQGRRTETGPDGKPREVVRLDRAHSSAVADAIAAAMVAENLKVWIFETKPRIGRSPSYRLLRVVTA